MAKKERTPAENFSWVRNQKVTEALRRAKSAEAWKPLGGLKHALAFWFGSDGIAWFILKNNLNPDDLQASFDASVEHPYLDADEIQPLLNELEELEAQYITKVNAVVAAAKAKLLKDKQ